MLAIAAMAAFSCNKEIKPQEELTPVSEPKVIVAYTDKDVLPDTKTSLSGVEIIWSETDAIKGLDYDGNVHTASNPTIEEQGKKATFTFQDLSIVDDIYTLAYPASVVTGIDGDYVYASIPSEQKATPNSFADGANLAIADGGVEVPVFKNVGGLLSIVINNDNIASVKLTANESLTGAAKISTANGENYASATITGGSSEVTLSGGLNSGNLYYAVVYPGTYTGLQIVITDNDGRTATYANPNELVVGRNANLFIAELTVADSKWVSLTKGAEWTYTFESKVYEANETKTLNGKDWTLGGDGGFWNQYNSNKGQQFGSGSAPYHSLTLTSNFGEKYGVSDVTVNASGANDIEATISVSVGGTALKCNDSETTSLTTSATDYTFSAASGKLLAGDIVISISQTSSKALYIKSIAVNPDIRQDVTLSFDTNSFELYLGSSDYNNFAGQTVSSSPSVTGIKYSLSGDAIGTVDENTGVVSLDGSTTGTATITASFDGDDNYKQASASYAITVNPAITGDIWTLVSDASTLTAGMQIVIANADADFAIGTTQNANNRAAVGVTAVPGGITIDSDVQIIALEKSGDYWLFNVGDNAYLYAASSSSNYLKTDTKTSVGDNGKWSISINSEGVASIKANGTNTRNVMQFNPNTSNNNPLFTCYSSASQEGIAIYTFIDNTEWTLSSINVTSQPTKTEYYVGDSFDATGMVVTATYADANDANHTKTAVVTGYTWEPSGALALNNNTVTVSYTEGGITKTDTVDITVSEKPTLTNALSISGLPTEFSVGDPFSFGEGTVKAVYSDKSEKTLSISDVTIEGFDSSAEATDQQVTIIYTEGDATATATITVDIIGGGIKPTVGTVLWAETWSNATTANSGNDNATPSANYGKGTIVYNNQTVSYSQSANTVYVRNENLAGGAVPELMLSSGKTWTISDIPTGGVKELTLTYKSNNTKSSVTCSTSGASISGSSKSYTITTGGAKTITLVFNCSGNTRIDDISLTVKTVE